MDSKLPHTESSVQDQLLPKDSKLPPKPLPKKRPRLIVLGVILLTGLSLGGIYLSTNKPQKEAQNAKGKKNQVIPVTVATVTSRTVPIQLQAIGNVQASSTVQVTPQASGRITGVYFKKGQEVKKGQLLFTLDDRTQLAAIEQAQANLNKDIAQIEQARATLAKDLGQIEQAKATLEKDLETVKQLQANLAKDQAQAQFANNQDSRYSELYKQGAVSEDQAQQYAANSKISAATIQAGKNAIANAQAVVRGDRVAITNAQAVVRGDQAAIRNAQAVLMADQAALNNAKVQLSYTRIYAPISGRAGNILVYPGNVVQANSSTPLVTIVQIRPIQVSFSVPEVNLPEIQKHLENGKLRVDVNLNKTGKSESNISGVLSFVNNSVDNSTGTIQLIGDFDNRQGKLWPGQYVKATLTLAQEKNALVVPSQAVQNGPKGQFVFVVKPDLSIQNVPVEVISTVGGLNVVRQGLQVGDRVVTDGQANLTPKSKIKIKGEVKP